jgi:hypothetical protein
VGSGRGGGRGLWDPVRQIIAGTGQECEAPKLFWLKGKREGRDSRRGEGEGSWEERLEGRRVGAMTGVSGGVNVTSTRTLAALAAQST